MYTYLLKDERRKEGYRLEFVLGALLSRVMTYLIFKRFGEVDPAKAHPKLTHARIATLLIPRVDFSDSEQKKAHDRVVKNVNRLLSGKGELGGKEDRAVELALRLLWGIEAEDGAYINGEFFDLPDGQAIRDLFPRGRPVFSAAAARKEVEPADAQ